MRWNNERGRLVENVWILYSLFEYLKANQKNVKWLLHSFECPGLGNILFSYSRLKNCSFASITLMLSWIRVSHNIYSCWNTWIRCKIDGEKREDRGARANKTIIMHGLYAIQCDCGFLFAANTKHIIRTFYVSYSLNVSAYRNFCHLISNRTPKWAFSHRA